MVLKPIGVDSKKSKGSGSPEEQEDVAMDRISRKKSFNAGRIIPHEVLAYEPEVSITFQLNINRLLLTHEYIDKWYLLNKYVFYSKLII